MDHPTRPSTDSSRSNPPSETKQGSKPPSIEPSTSENPQDEDNGDVQYVSGQKLLAITGSVTLVFFLLMLDQSILSTAIPQITSNFRSLPDVGWYVGAYPLTNAAFQLLAGKLYTYFRVKHTFLVFLFIFEFGSLICGVANSSPMLIVGRAISGAGAAGLFIGSMAIVTACTPLEKRAMCTGLMMGLGFTGIAMGPLVGGALTERVSWRWCFYINLPIGGLAAFCLFLVHLPDITPKEAVTMNMIRRVVPELDLFGFALFVPSIIMFLLALQFGSEETFAWNSPTIIGLFVGAGVQALIFIAWEYRRGPRAMVPGAIIKQRVVWSSGLQTFCLMAALVTASNYMPMYFQAIKGVGPLESGVNVLPSILSQLAGAVGSGAAVSKLGYYLPWAALSGAVTAIGNGLVSTFTESTSTGNWAGYQIILGFGRGCGMQMGMLAISAHVSPSQSPIALSILTFIMNLGSTTFIVISTTIFTQTITSSIKKYAPSVSPQAALGAGSSAAAVRALVPPGSAELSGVLKSYELGLRNVFFLLAGISVAGFAFSFGMGWTDVRKKETKKEEAKQEKDSSSQVVDKEEV